MTELTLEAGAAQQPPSPVAHGARWSLIGLVSKQVLRIGFSLLLARLLGPRNFGIVGQATIYLALSTVFLDLGVGAALIQRKTVSRKDEGTAAVMNFVVAASLVLLTLVTAPALANFFHTPELTSVLRVLSLTFVLTGFAIVPTAMLSRKLDFRTLGIAESVSTLLSGIVGVTAALMGANYWALVIQTLTRDALYLSILLFARGRPAFSWSTESWHRLASFSRNVLGAQLLGFIKSNADNILIGRYLGAPALAQYALSYRVLMLPVQVLGQTANRLMFPVLSQLSDQRDRVIRTYFRSTTSLALAVFPVMILVALNAPRAVPWAFGPDWGPAIRPMQILAIAAILRAVLSNTGSMVLAAGHAKFAFRWELCSTAIHIAAFVVGLQWGIAGVAWSFLLTGLPLGVLYLVLVDRLTHMGLARYVGAIAPAATASAAMIAMWFLVDYLLGADAAPFASLATLTLAASLAYFAFLAVAWSSLLREQIAFVRQMMRRGAPR